MADLGRFSCEGCEKTYGWKAELAGRKVKCKCGTVMVVPVEAPAPEEDGIFDLVPDASDPPPPPKRAMKQPVPLGNESIAGATAMGLAAIPAPARRAPRPATTTAPHATKAPPKVAAKPLSYQRGTTQRDRERTSIANTIEMVRDCYVPVALLIIGFVACLAAYLFRANASGESLAFIGLGLGGFMAVKALLMLGFAFLVAGPVGVSFGGIWTAILKLAAIAIFTDGAITWIHLGLDKLLSIRGMFAAMVSFPIALGLFWVLLIYLFSMDPGDSWLVVILLCVFDYVVRLALLMIVLAMVMRGL